MYRCKKNPNFAKLYQRGMQSHVVLPKPEERGVRGPGAVRMIGPNKFAILTYLIPKVRWFFRPKKAAG